MENGWRDDPRLQGRFHPECPDDLQVIVHDGGPRMTERRPELVWVRVTGSDGDAFTGRVLNQPEQLAGVAAGSTIRFLVPRGGEHPIQVGDRYLRERSGWNVHPCHQCGLTELFDAPSDLIRRTFPHLPAEATLDEFTAFCGVCGGIQVVERRGGDAGPPGDVPRPAGRPWWRFWG